MGGYGSGRRNWHSKKSTVEDCWTLDINWMTREGTFDGEGRRSGSISWSNYRGEQTSRIGYEVSVPQRWLRLHYHFTHRDEHVDYRVPLTTTALPWGGVRWWFICPLLRNGQYCGRRVGKLYLAPGGTYYGCRHCYDLTYESCQESHRYDRMWVMLAAEYGTSPGRVKREMEEDIGWSERYKQGIERRKQRQRRRKQRGLA